MSVLFDKVEICGIELRNRFVRSATYEGMATPDGGPSEKLAELYYELADGEIGLIITSGAQIDGYKGLPDIEGLPYPSAMDDDRLIDCWRPIVAGVHERGSKIAMQIVHPGRADNPGLRKSDPIAPSPVPIDDFDIMPKEMNLEEIDQMVDMFAQACRRVKEAGFDAVQLHGGHGYLISNFISPYTNVRTDKYGGNTENRARFIVEIVEKARELVGAEFPIMIKMNCDDFLEDGLKIDEAVKVAKIIVGAGIGCIEVTGGITETRRRTAKKGIVLETDEAYFKEHAAALKKNVSAPIILVGGLRTPKVIEKVIQDGVADLASMSRSFIREPGLVKRWKEGDLEKATCISCNKCGDKVFKKSLTCYIEEKVRKDAELLKGK